MIPSHSLGGSRVILWEEIQPFVMYFRMFDPEKKGKNLLLLVFYGLSLSVTTFVDLVQSSGSRIMLMFWI